MSPVIPISRLDKSNLDVAGGKGSNLGELARLDLPVPAGFVISTSAYVSFVEANELQEAILDRAAAVVVGDPLSAEAASKAIQILFQDGTVPESLASPIRKAYAEFEQDLPVAVRSSATAEDLPTASFAGQQDTYLNVRGEDALLDAVRNCWASLWTARAISYRARQGIDPGSVSLAVVVQELIPAEKSGILFTANPVDGQRDQILINAAWGLGEAIVGGLVTPDDVVLSKKPLALVSRETGSKSVMTAIDVEGTREIDVPAHQQDEQVLDEAEAIELARLGIEIEDHYGIPMDIEWAIANHKIAILQARPITSLPDPAPALPEFVWEPISPKTIWMRRQIVEHMPEPLSPLFEDLYLTQGLPATVDRLLAAMSGTDKSPLDMWKMMPDGFARTINGYAYTAASGKMDMSAVLPIIKIYARMPRLTKLPFFNFEEGVVPAYRSIIAHWSDVDLEAAEDAELLDGMAELAAADSTYWFGSAIVLGFSRVLDPVFDRLLKSFLVRGALPQPRPGSSVFLRGFDAKALDAQADLEALAERIRDLPEAAELIAQNQAEDMLAVLNTSPGADEVLERIHEYFEEYGHQIYNLDFADPTQIEDPMPVLLSLKALVQKPPQVTARARQAELAKNRDALVEATEKKLNPLSRGLFRWVWKSTKRYGPYREHVLFYLGLAWPTVRKLAIQLGQRLAADGSLAAAEDIYFLHDAEIRQAIEARQSNAAVPDLRDAAAERRALRNLRKRVTPPAKVPAGSTLKFGPFKFSMFDPTPEEPDMESAFLKGHGVSTGTVTGPASVVRSIDDFDQMQPGTILVCPTTTPAWTPLFSQAVGLVTDIGGALAHGSIVAREYGIPAVMGTGVATERIESGMMLVVDGDAGTVRMEEGE
jgi:pyruvate,water dikinase